METSGTFNEKRHVIRIESKRHIGKQCIIYLTIMCRWIVEQVLGAIEKNVLNATKDVIVLAQRIRTKKVVYYYWAVRLILTM